MQAPPFFLTRCPMFENILVGIFTGVLSGAFVGYIFYRRSKAELDGSVERLRSVMEMIAQALKGKNVRISYDEKGVATGLVFGLPVEAVRSFELRRADVALGSKEGLR